MPMPRSRPGEKFPEATVPVDALRQELQRIVESDDRWDGRVAQVVMTDVGERTVQVRALVSAADSGKAWDLRCAVREKCSVSAVDDAVSIHAVERFLGDLALERGWKPEPQAPPGLAPRGPPEQSALRSGPGPRRSPRSSSRWR